jgi:predicted MarR family transcription regulator
MSPSLSSLLTLGLLSATPSLTHSTTTKSTKTTKTKKDVMVWMCLDICGQGGEIASKNLQELSRHLDVVSGVSFEKYTLGPGAQLVTFDITEVSEGVWE